MSPRVFLIVSGLVFAAAAWADDTAPVSAKQIAPTASSLSASLPAGAGDFNSTAIASFDPRAKNFLRLETAWSGELNDAAQRFRVGDSISDPGTWGSAVRFAGLQFGTAFGLRSDLLTGDRIALAGLSVLPSAADALFAQVPDAKMLQRGMAVNGKTAVIAANNLSFTTRDASGRTTAFVRPLVAKDQAAPAGCNQFSMGVGRARKDYALASDSYGSLFANTTVVCGTDNGYTIEAHGEYLNGDAGLAGVDVMRPIAGLGTASLAMAASEKDDTTGWLLRAGLQHSNDKIDLNLRARVQSPDFRELGASPIDAAMTSRLLASVGAKISSRNTLALAYANQTMASSQRINIVALTQTIDLGANGTLGRLSIVADRSLYDEANSSVKVSYVRPLRN